VKVKYVSRTSGRNSIAI